VGQLLSVVNMQLNILSDKIPVEFQNELIETKKLVATTVNEVRTLSKTLNTDVVLKNGLVASLELELERFKRLNFLKVHYTMGGEITDIIKSDEIIIFRTLQEFLSNVVRHAGAENLFVNLSFNSETLDVEIRDDGIGFDTEKVVTSNGMQTMKSRAELIKADFLITSKIGEGTKLYLKYPYKHEW
jgi:signal transduction histidine kinase